MSKIGVGVVKANDAELASEICEELWTPQNMHQQLCLDGVDIISNGSASHHQLRKLEQRHQLLQAASARNYCVYMYTNLKGGEGNRLYFDGSGMIMSLG